MKIEAELKGFSLGKPGCVDQRVAEWWRCEEQIERQWSQITDSN